MPTSITKSGVSTTYVYEYAGQRIKKTVSTTTTVYIGKLYECTSSVCTKYVFGGSQKIASKKQGVVYYYHTDHLEREEKGSRGKKRGQACFRAFIAPHKNIYRLCLFAYMPDTMTCNAASN